MTRPKDRCGWTLALLVLAGCAVNDTEPASDKLLMGTWGAESFAPAVILSATAAGATFQHGCEQYRIEEPIRLRLDETFSVPANQVRGRGPGEEHRLDGRVQANGTVAVYLLPPRAAGPPGATATVIAVEHELSPGEIEDFNTTEVPGQEGCPP